MSRYHNLLLFKMDIEQNKVFSIRGVERHSTSTRVDDITKRHEENYSFWPLPPECGGKIEKIEMVENL